MLIMNSDRQPFDELEPNKNYELVLVAYDASASKFRIITEWEDENSVKHSKVQMGICDIIQSKEKTSFKMSFALVFKRQHQKLYIMVIK